MTAPHVTPLRSESSQRCARPARRVRLALAANPAITPVSAEALGLPKHVKAQQIVIQLYLNDPNAERFTPFTGKRYTFVIADDVPGHVLMIRTEVPGHEQRLRVSRAEGNHCVSRRAQDQGALKTPPSGAPAKPGIAPRASN